MNIVGQFEKVSFEQFKEDYLNIYVSNEDTIRQAYNNITLPIRATSGSAGYDFVSPIDFTLYPNRSITIPTGIRVKIDDGWFLGMFPKSGLGFKYRVQLDNTVGIIDCDYYFSDNEGHIMVKITNDSKSKHLIDCKVNSGKAFVQGIFIPFGITYDDHADGIRNGGFGSTDK